MLLIPKKETNVFEIPTVVTVVVPAIALDDQKFWSAIGFILFNI